MGVLVCVCVRACVRACLCVLVCVCVCMCVSVYHTLSSADATGEVYTLHFPPFRLSATHHWRTSKGFQYPGIPSALESNGHVKRPDPARRLELMEVCAAYLPSISRAVAQYVGCVMLVCLHAVNANVWL